MPDNMREYGATGLKRYSGIISEDFISDMDRASSRFKVYREMQFNDPVVAAVLFAVEQVLRNIDWLVEPSDEEDLVALERADFVLECKDDMSHTWNDFISECATFLVHGWFLAEIVYKKRLGSKPSGTDKGQSKFNDGLVGWRKFAPRSQESLDHWEFDDSGGVQGMYQRPAPKYEELFIPIEKALLFRTRVEKNNPEGRSVLRGAYRPWYWKKNLEVIMGIGIERNANGLPILYLPPSATKDDFEDARGIVEKVRRDEYWGLTLQGPKPGTEKADEPAGWLFELASTNASAFILALVRCLEYYDRRISMSVLAQFLMLGSTVGSWALSKDQSDLFLMTLQGWADMIAETINRHAIPKLMRMNGWDEEQSPKITPSPLAKENLAELAAWIEVMWKVGFNLADLEDHLRAMANLPPKEEGEDGEEVEEDGEPAPEEGREPEEEEEEVEMSKQDDEAWKLTGRKPAGVEDDWEFTDDDIEAIAEEFERFVSAANSS